MLLKVIQPTFISNYLRFKESEKITEYHKILEDKLPQMQIKEHYIENVSNINVTRLNGTQGEMFVLQSYPLYKNKDIYFFPSGYDMGTQDCVFKWIIVTGNQNNKKFSLLTNCTTYFLNDTGQTIESLIKETNMSGNHLYNSQLTPENEFMYVESDMYSTFREILKEEDLIVPPVHKDFYDCTYFRNKLITLSESEKKSLMEKIHNAYVKEQTP